MIIRYDDGEDDILDVSIVRADDEGEPISPPILRIVDKATGERYTLDRLNAWRLRDLINRM